LEAPPDCHIGFGETALRPQTDTQVLDQLSFPAMEL
jgi:predicted phage gp36 major capsid-like protein